MIRSHARKQILLICGSLNQTTMMHAIGRELADHDCYYTPYYCDGVLRQLSRFGLLDFTIIGEKGAQRRLADEYTADMALPIDWEGRHRAYDLVITCSDLVIQRNIRGKPIVLVQEGMTDPENFSYRMVRALGLPRWLASTSTTGLSLAYEAFCVASEGYRDFFGARGIPSGKLIVTGIPNYDDCRRYLHNDFPERDYVLVATSDTRETFKRDDRAKFFGRVTQLAGARRVIVKLHPNENVERATAEIRTAMPEALVLHEGDINHMIANCDVLVTQYSTVVYTGLALGKECHSYFDISELRRMTPQQNGGRSGRNIADVCERILARVGAPAVIAEALTAVAS